MPCSHAGGRTGASEETSRGLDRREFMKSALAIGGSAALASTMEITGLTGTANAGSRISNRARDNRQHAWADYLATDSRGIAIPPAYHTLLYLNYNGSGAPATADRVEMEEALQQLEKAFDWSNEGLLFTVNYSPAYYDRFSESLPAGVDLRGDRDIIDSVKVGNEDPVPESDSYEILIDLASDNVSNILAAEDALWGEKSSLNGVTIDATFEGIFDRPTSYPARRTGFVGTGIPREEFDDTRIPKEAPLSMGFESVFDDNIPAEDDVTMIHNQTLGGDMPPGVYAQGSIQTNSVLEIDLDSWYSNNTFEERANKMYSPHHTSDEVGDVGRALGATSGTSSLPMRDKDASDDIARRTQQDAQNKGVVGHAQKLARARFDLAKRDSDGQDDGVDDTTILRRDFNTSDVGKSGLHFLALMRFNSYFEYVRESMNGVGFKSDQEIVGADQDSTSINHDAVDIPLENDGFLAFITTLRRGQFVAPPLTLRSLPLPRAAQRLTLEVNPGSDSNTIDLSESTTDVAIVNTADHEIIDGELEVYFGEPGATNKLQSAFPVSADARDFDGDGDFDIIYTFENDRAGLDTSDDTARMLVVDDKGRSHAGMVSVDVVS